MIINSGDKPMPRNQGNQANQENQGSDNVPRLRFQEFSDKWKSSKFKDLCVIVGGGTPDTNIAEYWDNNILWFTPTELKEKYIAISKRTISEKGLNKSSAKLLPKGTLLFSSRATIGEVSIALHECTTNQGFQSMIVNNENSNEFIYYWIKNHAKVFIEKASGSTFLEISKSSIQNISLFIPSLPEQQKIASFLTTVDEKLQALKKKKTLLEQYKKGVMQKIFSQEIRFKPALSEVEGADNGKEFPEWEEKMLSNVIKLQCGYSFKSDLFKDNGIPIIRISNISNDHNYINTANTVYYNKLSNDNNFIIKKGDLLIAMSGATTGKSSIYNLNYVSYLNQRVGLFKKISNQLNYSYLIQIVFSKQFTDQLTSVLVAGAQPNVSSSDIESLTFTFPCVEEQTKIANILSAIDDKINHCQTQIEKTEMWKKGLLQRMFC